MPYIETVKWHTRPRQGIIRSVSKTHISAGLNKTLCGIEIPIDPVFRSHLLQSATCKRCLAKQTAAA